MRNHTPAGKPTNHPTAAAAVPGLRAATPPVKKAAWALALAGLLGAYPLAGSFVSGGVAGTGGAHSYLPAANADETTPASATPASATPAVGMTETVEVDGTTVTVPRDVKPGEEITITGTGWSANTQMAVKLRYQRASDRWAQTFARATNILKHPKSGQPDPTLWVLMESDNDGAFRSTFTIPTDLAAGEKFYVNVTQGLLESSGVPNVTLNSAPMRVDGVAWEGVDDNVECVTDLDFPTYEVATAPVDGKIHISGRGWCNPQGGASLIAVKIDEAAISRLESNKVDANLTIWDYIVPDPATGDFDYDMPLPDGTTSGPLGSTPAFGDGSHTLRFLTGSIKVGDPVRSLPFSGKRDTVFVQGEYKPNGIPETVLADEEIVPATRGGVTIASRAKNSLTLFVPAAEPGDFIYVSGFTTDGSRRIPWDSTWFVADANKNITIPTDVIPARYNNLNLLLQDGSLENFGQVMGWVPWERSALDVANNGNTTGANTTGGNTTGGTTSTAASANTAATSDLVKTAGEIDKLLATFTKDVDKGTNLLTGLLGHGTTTSAAGNSAADDAGEVVEVVEYAPALAGTRAANQVTAAPRPAAAAGTTPSARVNATAAAGGANASNTTHVDTPQPTFVPEPPVKHKGKLTPRNNGGYAAALRDGQLVITTSAPAGEWAYVYLYSSDEAIPVGWTQIADDRTITVSTDGLGAGEWAFAVQDTGGQLMGWAGLSIPDSAEVVAAESSQPALVVDEQPLMRGADWALIIGAVALVELVLIGVFLWNRPRRTKN